MKTFKTTHRAFENLAGIGFSILVLALFMVLPFITSRYIMGLITVSLIASICAMSYNLLMGYAGLLSFGHVIGWGIGTYTAGILVGKGLTQNFWVVLGVALVSTLIIVSFLGFLALRTRDVYFALITLAMSEIIRALILKGGRFTGGENGLTGIARPWGLEDTHYYFFVLVIFIICYFLIRWAIDSWYGRDLVGIRENEPRMLMLGYNVWLFKYITFIITQLFSAVAGLLSSYYIGIAAPDSFSFVTSGSFLLMVLIGGLGTINGPVIGAFFVVFSTNYLSAYTNDWMALVGIIFIVVVMFARKGIGGYLTEWSQKVQAKMMRQ